MFIGWIRKNSFSIDLEEFSSHVFIDKTLVTKTFEQNNSLCFGAYEQNKLVAFISATELEQTILINNFYYTNEIDDDIKKRIIKLLLNNLDTAIKPILVMSTKDEKEILIEFDFNEYAKFKKAMYTGGAVFNFSNATAKSISNENFIPILTSIDHKAFNENRVEYIKNNLLKQSSLILSTEFGYQHSYAINKSYIKISPWVMQSGAFSDAEKILRGIIYHRGLKKIFAFIPSDVEEITNLYESYKFDLSNEYSLMYLNSKPSIDLDMVYAF
ncbi:hypothetical protein HUE87_07720 [Candidatus Sulfurimonas marisnigri]|uniref:Uncharacterized protein n=1 Tax=Candidatus Sulfurimonas marisnigri TaxID=2740405 RepID=A0A7S7RPR2_9BACT|nr:hypothetical protein [Candidatus Sulfurimonas marisnigri]QOY53788.1 hypothetical protein HUE87_07720 [Candidatus Sulfurimonas marisnigri]